MELEFFALSGIWRKVVLAPYLHSWDRSLQRARFSQEWWEYLAAPNQWGTEPRTLRPKQGLEAETIGAISDPS